MVRRDDYDEDEYEMGLACIIDQHGDTMRLRDFLTNSVNVIWI